MGFRPSLPLVPQSPQETESSSHMGTCVASHLWLMHTIFPSLWVRGDRRGGAESQPAL